MDALNQAVVTTSGKQDNSLSCAARTLALNNNLQYVPREKQSISKIMDIWKLPVIVAGRNGLKLYLEDETSPFFFHPNAAVLKVKNFRKTGYSPLLKAGSIKKGDTILDGTLGLGSDSLLLSAAAGRTGKVLGIESRFLTALIVKEGLKNYPMPTRSLEEAAEGISVQHAKTEDVLRNMKPASVDVVYFDPMFYEAAPGAFGMSTLRLLADYQPLTEDLVHLALRAARRRVVVKDNSRSPVFEKFGFKTDRRPHAACFYGYLNREEEYL